MLHGIAMIQMERADGSLCAENWFSLLCTLSQTLDLEKFCYCTLTFTSVVSLVQLRTITSFSLSC